MRGWARQVPKQRCPFVSRVSDVSDLLSSSPARSRGSEQETSVECYTARLPGHSAREVGAPPDLATMAASNKHLAQSNKSRTAKANKRHGAHLHGYDAS